MADVTQTTKENIGHVIQVLGAVVDIEFDSGIRPRLQTALRTTNPLLNDKPFNLVLEVAQHLPTPCSTTSNSTSCLRWRNTSATAASAPSPWAPPSVSSAAPK